MPTTPTKEKILDATIALVSQKGYLGATTREIAHGAGVTELTLFRHFGTKEKLFEACLNRNTFLPTLKELMPDLDGMSYEDALRTVGRSFLLSLKARKAIVKIMQAEMCRYPDKMRKMSGTFFDEMLGTLAGYFTARQRKGELRSFPPEVAARMFLGMLFSYFRTEEIMRGVDITKKGRMEAAVNGFVDIFVHGTTAGKNGALKGKRT